MTAINHTQDMDLELELYEAQQALCELSQLTPVDGDISNSQLLSMVTGRLDQAIRQYVSHRGKT